MKTNRNTLKVVETDRKQITRRPLGWPESEPIPQTLEEALAAGWEISGHDDIKMSEGEASETGVVSLMKDYMLSVLWIEFPYRATYAYEKARNPRVRSFDGWDMKQRGIQPGAHGV